MSHPEDDALQEALRSFTRDLKLLLDKHYVAGLDSHLLVIGLLHGAAVEAINAKLNRAKFANEAHQAYHAVINVIDAKAFDALTTTVLRKDPK